MTIAATCRSFTINHMVIASNQPYEKVLEGLQSHLGSEEGWRQTERRIQDLVAAHASLEQVEETIVRQLGASYFTIFKTAEHTPLHLLAGKTSRAIQTRATFRRRTIPTTPSCWRRSKHVARWTLEMLLSTCEAYAPRWTRGKLTRCDQTEPRAAGTQTYSVMSSC